jgi:hypothetical protein
METFESYRKLSSPKTSKNARVRDTTVLHYTIVLPDAPSPVPYGDDHIALHDDGADNFLCDRHIVHHLGARALLHRNSVPRVCLLQVVQSGAAVLDDRNTAVLRADRGVRIHVLVVQRAKEVRRPQRGQNDQNGCKSHDHQRNCRMYGRIHHTCAIDRAAVGENN